MAVVGSSETSYAPTRPQGVTAPKTTIKILRLLLEKQDVYWIQLAQSMDRLHNKGEFLEQQSNCQLLNEKSTA